MLTVNGKAIDWSEGMTVSDLFKIMDYDYALIVVSVNNQTIHKDCYQSFVIEDHSTVKMMHICHGG
ncbi:MAG: sulfur carrier protein ThiS [Deltaproteobacteria bacterium]|jgi:thiamine biosynthesis protein ThiS|nr:sulfur carrier protein ThiS [Deltaproteobacteria bacterium]